MGDQGPAAYRYACEVSDVMACINQPSLLAFEPFMLCGDVLAVHTSRDACLGLQCGGTRWARERDAGRVTGPPPEVEFISQTRCSELEETRTTGACCFAAVHPRSDGAIWANINDPTMVPTTDCRHVTRSECESGILKLRTIDELPSASWCFLDRTFFEHFGRVHILADPDDNDGPLAPISPARRRATLYHGDHTLCKCTSREEPFIIPRLVELGFTECLLLPQDVREFDSVCELEPPDDEFDCRTLGMPLIIDDEGFATFDAGNRRISPDPDECVDVVADLYIDSDGFARAIACRKFNDEGQATEIAISTLHQEQCAAMYGDYRWDELRPC